MFIKDLQPRQTGVDVEGDVFEMSDVREFNKLGRQGKVATAWIKDGTGKIKLSLWNEQIDNVKVGNKLKVHNGYIGEFQGELQLTTGKFGTIEILSTAETKDDSQKTAEEKEQPKPAVNAEVKVDSKVEHAQVKEKKETVIESLDIEEEDFT